MQHIRWLCRTFLQRSFFKAPPVFLCPSISESRTIFSPTNDFSQRLERYETHDTRRNQRAIQRPTGLIFVCFQVAEETPVNETKRYLFSEQFDISVIYHFHIQTHSQFPCVTLNVFEPKWTFCISPLLQVAARHDLQGGGAPRHRKGVRSFLFVFISRSQHVYCFWTLTKNTEYFFYIKIYYNKKITKNII